MRSRFWLAGLVSLVACASTGCATTSGAQALAENPLVVPSADFETVWRASVVAVDQFFDIASEDRAQRKIVTQTKSGATLLEPWEIDSVGFQERLECTLQTIRRFAIITVNPSPTGQGWAVKVVVYKELEDLLQPDRQSIGRAVFQQPVPAQSVERGRRPGPGPRLLDPPRPGPQARTSHHGQDPLVVIPSLTSPVYRNFPDALGNPKRPIWLNEGSVQRSQTKPNGIQGSSVLWRSATARKKNVIPDSGSQIVDDKNHILVMTYGVCRL